MRVFTDIGACSLMVGVTCGALLSRVGDWCVGFVARLGSLFLFAVFVSPYLDSNPARCRVRLLSGSLTLCGWGSSPLLSAEAHAA